VVSREARRVEIVEKLARHVLRAGLRETGLRRLAAVAGSSDRMLLYYFADKDEILTAVLTRIAAELTGALDALLGGSPLPPARALEAVWEALKRGDTDHLELWLELSSRASRGDRFFGAIVARIREDWVARLSRILDVPDEERAPLAILLMAAVDGQAVLFPTDLARGDAAIRAHVRLLERAR
jgi:AcrR family transcriptional regulator